MTTIPRTLTVVVVTAVIAASAIGCGPTDKPTAAATSLWTLSDGGWWASVTPIPTVTPTPQPPAADDPNQQPPPTGSVSISSDLLFDFGSSDLSGAADTVIANVTTKLMASNVSIAIHGNCDDVGPASVNFPLSRARAHAVADAMIKDGFPQARIALVDGYGSTEPRALPPDTPSNRALNRRVDIQILS